MNDQEAEKLIADQIADMRNDLTALTGTTDEDKLIRLVLEKRQRVVVGFKQLRRLVWRSARPIVVAEFHWAMNTVREELYTMAVLAQMAQRNPDYTAKVKLVDAVARRVALMDASLDKIAQALREKAG
jgi:hypothetical protein